MKSGGTVEHVPLTAACTHALRPAGVRMPMSSPLTVQGTVTFPSGGWGHGTRAWLAGGDSSRERSSGCGGSGCSPGREKALQEVEQGPKWATKLTASLQPPRNYEHRGCNLTSFPSLRARIGSAGVSGLLPNKCRHIDNAIDAFGNH